MHSGDAYFSPLWKKPRSEGDKTREESIIGKPVELVQEMLHHGNANQILASELSYDLADGQSRFAVAQSEPLTLDEGRLTMSSFMITSRSGTHAELLQRQCRHLLPDQESREER